MAGLPISKGSAGRPLRVALVTSSYNYIKDGVALTLNRLVAFLEAQGVEVLVFAPTAPEPAFQHAGTIVAVPSVALPARPEYRLALGMPADVREKLKAFAPDIIHIAVPDLLGMRALKLAREEGIPAVATYHTRYETYLKHYWYAAPFTGLLKAHLRRFYGACREVYVPSTDIAESLKREGCRDNFRIWPRGIDASRFDPVKRSTGWRAQHGIGVDEVVVLHVSRLVREKRIDVLAGMLNGLKGTGAPHRVVIVGDGPELETLQAALPHAVFTGTLDGEMLAIAYASSDIFVFPSETESFGNVTLEAMASGLACLWAQRRAPKALPSAGTRLWPGCWAGIVRWHRENRRCLRILFAHRRRRETLCGSEAGFRAPLRPRHHHHRSRHPYTYRRTRRRAHPLGESAAASL